MKTIKGQALPAPAKKALSFSSWSDEFVAYPALSEEHLGIAGVILQFLSEPLDIFPEVTGVEVFLTATFCRSRRWGITIPSLRTR